MARRGDVDFAGTEDYDALLFGSPLTLRQLTSKGDPELMDLDATLETHDLTWEQLIDVAILCGTDFNEGVSGYGPKTSVKAVREHGDIWGVIDAEGLHVENADRIRQLFLNPSVIGTPSLALDVSPDVEAARAYVTEQWEVDENEVAKGFERIEESMVQTGLDEWS